MGLLKAIKGRKSSVEYCFVIDSLKINYQCSDPGYELRKFIIRKVQ